MKPIAVLPFHDPQGLVVPHFQRALAEWKPLFSRCLVSLSYPTCLQQPQLAGWFEADAFFEVLRAPQESMVGPQFGALFSRAARLAQPDQLVHLCFPDRVAFAVLSEHRVQFLADIQSIRSQDTPLIFQRSEAAWASHPQNYANLERTASQVGQALLGRFVDFAWCYLVAAGADLRQMTDGMDDRGICLMGEMVLHAFERIQTRDVDWLAWEDAFILGRDADQLRGEREASLEEMRKRLDYVVPTIDLILAEAKKREKSRNPGPV